MMKSARSTKSTLSLLALGLIFMATVPAQAQSGEPAMQATDDVKTEVCVYNISGKDGASGMYCSGCTGAVKTALLDVDGIVSVDAVDLETGTATVTIAVDSEAKARIPYAIAEVNFVATLIDEDQDERSGDDDEDDEDEDSFLSRIRALFKTKG